jgi:hypothetical protein
VLGWLLSTSLISHNIIHSTSQALFILPVEHSRSTPPSALLVTPAWPRPRALDVWHLFVIDASFEGLSVTFTHPLTTMVEFYFYPHHNTSYYVLLLWRSNRSGIVEAVPGLSSSASRRMRNCTRPSSLSRSTCMQLRRSVVRYVTAAAGGMHARGDRNRYNRRPASHAKEIPRRGEHSLAGGGRPLTGDPTCPRRG